jgi:hypothetical protein
LIICCQDLGGVTTFKRVRVALSTRAGRWPGGTRPLR